jgi:hypothetical protein
MNITSIYLLIKLELIYSEWNDIKLNVNRPLLQNWKINAQSTIKVRNKDKWLGTQDLTINQKSYVDKDKIIVESVLGEPSKSIKKYKHYTLIYRYGTGTKVKESIDLQIRTIAPKIIISKEFIRSEMQKSNKESLSVAEEVMRKIASREPPLFTISPKMFSR